LLGYFDRFGTETGQISGQKTVQFAHFPLSVSAARNTDKKRLVGAKGSKVDDAKRSVESCHGFSKKLGVAEFVRDAGWVKN
jgi:hypothetical protein